MHASRASRTGIAAAVLMLSAWACGGGDGDGDGGGPPANRQASTTTRAPAASSVAVTAFDIGFWETNLAADAGEVEVVYVNDGATLHRFLVDGLEEELELEVPTTGDRDTGTIRLEPGGYTFYCNVPGHRAVGMEGTLTIS